MRQSHSHCRFRLSRRSRGRSTDSEYALQRARLRRWRSERTGERHGTGEHCHGSRHGADRQTSRVGETHTRFRYCMSGVETMESYGWPRASGFLSPRSVQPRGLQRGLWR